MDNSLIKMVQIISMGTKLPKKQTKKAQNSTLLQPTKTSLTASFPCSSLPLCKIVTTNDIYSLLKVE